MSLINKTKNRIWKYIKHYFYDQRVVESILIQNLNYSSESDQQKMLICYTPSGFFINLDSSDIGRTIPYEIFKMVNVFSEFDYCIDIIDCNDIDSLRILESKCYSLIFGFGEAFYQITELQPKAISILYMTENHPDISYREEMKRMDYYYERHGKRISFARTGNYYKSYHLKKKHSHIITLSETEPLKGQYEKPYSIFPTGLINPSYRYKLKNHKTTRRDFLYFGGSFGAIHKGLDLLLDIFSNRDDISLHICGLSYMDRKFLRIPGRENIIDYGYVNVKSDIFPDIVKICSFVLIPSCSEGFSTSITTCMLHGLIPVVIKNTGFNRLEDNAIFLDDYKIDYIDAKLTEIKNMDSDELTDFSKKVYDFARQNFTISMFEKNFRIIIENILKNND